MRSFKLPDGKNSITKNGCLELFSTWTMRIMFGWASFWPTSASWISSRRGSPSIFSGSNNFMAKWRWLVISTTSQT